MTTAFGTTAQTETDFKRLFEIRGTTTRLSPVVGIMQRPPAIRAATAPCLLCQLLIYLVKKSVGGVSEIDW